MDFPVAASYQEWIKSQQQNCLPPGETFQANVVSDNTSILSSVSSCSSKEKKREKWNNAQTAILIQMWAENIDKIESATSQSTWVKIKEAVDKRGSGKSLKQCKAKLRTLKDAYKKAKDNNKKTGTSPVYCQFYQEIDAVLGCRDVVNLPESFEVGQATSNSQATNNNDVPINDPAAVFRNDAGTDDDFNYGKI